MARENDEGGDTGAEEEEDEEMYGYGEEEEDEIAEEPEGMGRHNGYYKQ